MALASKVETFQGYCYILCLCHISSLADYSPRAQRKISVQYSSISNSLIRYAATLKTTSIIFAVAPQISIATVPPNYIEGSAVNITCTASGIPDPDVKWFRNDIMKSEGTKTAWLTFNNVSRTDDGQYKCQANNSAGEIENYVELVVHCK